MTEAPAQAPAAPVEAPMREPSGYGYTPEDPIKVGGGPQGEHEYLQYLRGPEGQRLRFERRGSCCGFEDPSLPFGGGLLDMYEVTYAGVWGATMALVALVPVGGTALVWGPIGGMLLLAGKVNEGVFLLAWGTFVVSSIDNVLRPKLCGSRMTLHPLLVFLSMFGGLAVFGMMGLLVGPLIASIFMAMVRIYRRDFLGFRPVPESVLEPVPELVPELMPDPVTERVVVPASSAIEG